MAQTYQPVLESLPEKQWVAEAHSGDIDPGGRGWQLPLWGAPFTTWMLVVEAAIVDSNLQLISTQTWLCPTAQRSRNSASPISRQAAWRSLSPQQPLDMALPIRGPKTQLYQQWAGKSPRAPGPQQCTPGNLPEPLDQRQPAERRC